ncbi:hypothetical protein [Salsipaludibacter albus]|uniref:hypothetical protein n=1 Tax=Salsipaludibacter albus TaxID=2849650 RepID=UPI001EE3CFDE|nr:hypothetical protein [Salsipaludibacter albus]MBY5163778.1 hypothetical protein [Salsipaludibacter albus]
MPPVDCERLVEGFLGQPVNALTSLAFVVAGLVVLVRTRRAWLAAALVSTGVGSVLSHGPMPPGSAWAHDVSLTWLLVVAGASGTPVERWSTWPALAAIGLAVAVVPTAAVPLAVVAAVGALGAILWRDRSPRTLAALALLATGAAVGRLAAAGVLCDPDSLLQGHGVWHLAAATAVAVWATGQHDDRAATATSNEADRGATTDITSGR